MSRAVEAGLVLFAFGAVAAVLVVTRPEPKTVQPADRAFPVETKDVVRRPVRRIVHAQGAVEPATEVTLTPQIDGRVVWVSPSLRPGAIVREGAELVRIERIDHELAVRDARGDVDVAAAELELERARAAIAEREWNVYEDEFDRPLDPSRAALRKPQLAGARARLEAAEARVEQLRLDLSRTVVKAPFDALVLEEMVDPGSTVSPLTSLVRMVGTAQFRVRAYIPVSDLPYVAIPDIGGGRGSRAEVVMLAGDHAVRRVGRVIQLEGELDSGRMATLLVAIDDPLGLEGARGDEDDQDDERHGLPLLLNAYVRVAIRAEDVEDLIEVPRAALSSDEDVFVFDDGKLRICEVEVAWGNHDAVMVSSGLPDAVTVVTSPIARPVPGMRLRREEELVAAP